MSKPAAATRLNRESLYRMLSRVAESKDAGVGGALKRTP
jgi:DNA-binding phage protein